MRRTSCRLLRARRKSTGCASASSGRAAKPRRWRRSWKKKSSSSPGLRASARVRRPPGAQFPEVRPSRIQLACARAAARRARAGDHADHAQGLPAWPDDRRRLLRRDAVLDHAGHGPLRRSPDVGRGHSQRGARRVPRTLSCRVCGRDAAAALPHSGHARLRLHRSCGWRPSWDGRIS